MQVFKQIMFFFDRRGRYQIIWFQWEGAERIPTYFAIHAASWHRKPTGNRCLTFTRKPNLLTFTSSLRINTNHGPITLFQGMFRTRDSGLRASENRWRFVIPKIWCESKNYSDECYFGSVSVARLNQKRRRFIDFPSLHSAFWPMLH